MDKGEKVVNNLYPALCGICEELYVGRGEQFVYFNLSVVSYGFTYVDRGEKIVSDFFLSFPAVYFFCIELCI